MCALGCVVNLCFGFGSVWIMTMHDLNRFMLVLVMRAIEGMLSLERCSEQIK